MQFNVFRLGAVWLTSSVRTRMVATVPFLALALTGIAYAHHGYGGRYDMAAPVWIEGVVVESYFGQPHSELTVQVAANTTLPSPLPDLGPAGNFLDAQSLTLPDIIAGRTIVLELPPTRQYSTLGDRIRQGDRVSAVAVRNCEPSHQLNVQWLRLQSGEVESRSAAMSYMVNGC